MAVLSDKTLKERIAKNELILNGNVDSAKHCSYEFTAASILRGGSHEVEQMTQSAVAIKPAQLVWIRAREAISMPKNMVGLWIQTQTLSRKGLLLLNISLVEPGYKGPLSAVLVNFGKEDVIITPGAKIAKIMFLPLDGDTDKPVGEWNSQRYDASLMKMAASGPKTFLQLQSFEQKAEDILNSMNRRIEQRVNDIAAQTKDKLKEDLQGGLKRTLIKWGGATLVGLFFGCTIVWLMISSYLPRLSEYSKFDESVRRAAVVQQAETVTGLRTKLDTQEKVIESIKKQLETISSTLNKTQSQDKTIVTTPVTDTK